MRTWFCHNKGQLHPKRGNTLQQIFIILINSSMHIWVKDGSWWGHGCVNPRGSYGPRLWIPCKLLFMILINALMINWVKYGSCWRRGCIRPRDSYGSKWESLAKKLEFWSIILAKDESKGGNGCVTPRGS